MNNRFFADDDSQKAVRDAVLGPGLYGCFSKEGRYVFIDKGRLATILQKRFAVDTVLQSTSGNAVFIEEKIVRWPISGKKYEAMTLETRSCTVPGHESDGWMVYGEADWLNYAMCQENGDIACYLVDFPKLKEAFWSCFREFNITISRQHNRTECRVVPLEWIKAAVGFCYRYIHATPEGAEIVRTYNSEHYRKVGET